MEGIIKNIGGSTFVKIPKKKVKELNLIDGTKIDFEIKKSNLDFLWGKGKGIRKTAQEFKDELRKEEFEAEKGNGVGKYLFL